MIRELPSGRFVLTLGGYHLGVYPDRESAESEEDRLRELFEPGEVMYKTTRDKISLALLQHLVKGPSDAAGSYIAVADIMNLPPQLRSLPDREGRTW